MQKQTNFVSRQIVNTTWSLTYTGPPIPTYANTLIHVLNAISCNDAPGSDWSSQAASWAEASIRTTATKISQQIKALNKTGATLLSIPSLVRMVSLGCCVVTVTLLPSLDPRSVSRSVPSLVRMVSLGCCVVTVTLLPSLDPRSVSRSVPSLVRMVSLGCCVVTVTLLPSLDPRSVSKSKHVNRTPCFCLSPPSSELSVGVLLTCHPPCSHL